MSDEHDDLCSVCKNTKQWHEDNNAVHAFTTDGGLKRKDAQPVVSKQEKAQVVRGMPADPILRATLIRKGVITADDLAETERMLLGSAGGVTVFSMETGDGTG